MHTNFSFTHVWNQGDEVSHLVAIILVSMSLLTWTIIFLNVIAQFKQKAFTQRIELFWHSQSFKEGLEILGPHKDNIFFKLAKDGQESIHHLGYSTINNESLVCEHVEKNQLHDQLDLSDWITRALRNSVESSTARLQSGITLLASIGSTAPFIGLFGTVWGVYHALVSIGKNSQTSLDQIAGPIGEALIMTALGLAVAIPAVLAYNALVRANKKIASALNRFSYELHAYLVTGARIDAKQTQNIRA
jgi:biopolymer transport protein ExbB